MIFSETDCFSVLGMRGSGKSYLAMRIIEKYARKIILDPMQEYKGDIYIQDIESLKIILNKIKKEKIQKYTVVFRPSIHIKSTDDLINALFSYIYELGDCLLVIDEAQLICNPHHIPHYLKVIYTTGRHRKIGVLALTQRPGQIHGLVLSQSTHIFCGQLHEKNDLKNVSDFLDFDSKIIKTLGRRKFIYFSPFADKIRIFSTENKK